jgi:hypothetical protein
VRASDVFVTVLALVGPVVLGAALGHRLGRGWLGVFAAVGVGVLLTLGALVIWYLLAPKSVTGCYECSEYWGRWMDQTMFTTWLPLTLSLWSLGVVVGATKRGYRSPDPAR